VRRKLFIGLLGIIIFSFLIPHQSHSFKADNLSKTYYPKHNEQYKSYPVKAIVKLHKKADRNTFRAWLNGKNITKKFKRIKKNKYRYKAYLSPEDGLRITAKGEKKIKNTLKTRVKDKKIKGKKRGNDIDKMKFYVKMDVDAMEIVGSEGGVVEVTNPDSNLLGAKVDIAPDALNLDTIISIQEVDLDHALPQGTVTGGPVIDLDPDGTVFNNNIQVTIPYDDADDDGIVDNTGDSEDNISVVTWDDTNQTWIALNIIAQDTQNNTLTIETNHFTKYSTSSSCTPREDVVVFTIDGLDLVKTILVHELSQPTNVFSIWDFFPRSKYLNKAIYKDMNLGLNKCDVLPYSWSGDSYHTPIIMSDLKTNLKTEFDKAKDDIPKKKFILITHSWGTQLGRLALRHTGIQPDLFITLSDPSEANIDSSNYINGNCYSRLTVQEVQNAILNFTGSRYQETFDLLGIPPNSIEPKYWINYWDVGDVFSGPIDVNNHSDVIDDRKVTAYGSIHGLRTYQTTKKVHAITSLWEDYWEEFGVAHSEGEQFRHRVEADIRAVIGKIQLSETRQKTCYDESGKVIDCTGTGQDGEIQAGVDWPNPRFTDNDDGTVTDNLTGLMWLKDADCFGGYREGMGALQDIASINAGSTFYDCQGYDEASTPYTDWRLPNINELESLVNAEEPNSATWLNREGFTNVSSGNYFSSTTYASGIVYYVCKRN
jgi:hypothetical protein